MAENRYGLDTDYFKQKLLLIVRDIENYKPSELSRELSRLANTAAPGGITAKEIAARKAVVIADT